MVALYVPSRSTLRPDFLQENPAPAPPQAAVAPTWSASGWEQGKGVWSVATAFGTEGGASIFFKYYGTMRRLDAAFGSHVQEGKERRTQCRARWARKYHPLSGRRESGVEPPHSKASRHSPGAVDQGGLSVGWGDRAYRAYESAPVEREVAHVDWEVVRVEREVVRVVITAA